MKHAITLLMVLAFSFHLIAQPTTITWQGKLLDASGNAITQNNVAMTFAMFDASTGGNKLWPASGVVTKTVDVEQGLYSVQLGTDVGDDIAFTATMFDGKTPWLEVKVGTETLPRTEITSVPFALISNELSATGWESPGEVGKTTPNSGKFTSLETENLKITTGASDGNVLTSDAAGNASWQSLNFSETDPVFGSSAAKGITSADITNWNNKISSQWTTSGSDIYYNSGNVGIGVSTPHAPLHLSNSLGNRKIVLYQTLNNEHEFFGFGINDYTLRYQVDGTNDSHVFYAGNSSTGSNELFRIKGTGEVVIPAFTTPGILLNNASGTLSSTKGAAYQVLRMNDAGTSTQWSYMVASVSGLSPIISNGGINPLISILPASSSSAGSMSAADKIKLDTYPEGTVAGQMQYWNGSAWVTINPGTTGQVLEFTNGAPAWVDKTYEIGDFAQGGIVFWVDETGEHGLVCAKNDQSAGVRWYAGTFGTTQAKGDGPFAGEANTSIIIAAQVAIGDDGNTYAARICNELKVTEGGKTYGDWYLPSKDELYMMFYNRQIINATAGAHGGSSFSTDYYWSSTEFENLVWVLYFSSAYNWSLAATNDINRVRAVRAF